MSESKGRKIRLIYGIVLSVFTALIGVLFITQVLRIYYSGAEKPYSYELVSLRLQEITLPVILWVIAVIGGAVVWAIFPEKGKLSASVDEKATLGKLKKRLPELGEEYAEEKTKMQKKAKTRTLVRAICAGLCGLCAIVCAVYLFDFKNFPVEDNGSKVTAEVLQMVWAVLPWLVACFLFCLVATMYESKLLKEETALVKSLIAQSAKKGVVVKAKKEEKQEKSGVFSSKNLVLYARVALLCLGVVFVVVGVCNGGMKDVFAKAIKICTECIGLG